MTSVVPTRSPPRRDTSPLAEATAVVTVVSLAGATRIADLAQSSPLRLLFPRVEAAEPLTACLTNTAGGLVGGDALSVRVEAGEQARLLVMAQAAEKVYRSTGANSRIQVDLTARDHSWLEWLPQETILFEGARLERRTRLRLEGAARALVGEIVVFGRAARGERVTCGRLRDALEVVRDGALVWTDALDMDSDLAAALAHPAGFAGARASALMLCAGGTPTEIRDALRALESSEGVRFGATVVGGLLLARWLGWDVLAMRRHFGAAWATARSLAGGLPARLPALWHV